MRPIKFRAWDGEQMIYPKEHDVYFTIGGDENYWECYLRGNEEIPWFTAQDEGTVLLQSLDIHTRILKDKNGKEIYQDDVLICPHLDALSIIVRIPVVYHSEYTDPQLPLITIIEHESNIEIIGNIYENPELLNK